MLTYKSTIDFSDESNKEIEGTKNLKEFESYKKIKTALNRIEKNYIEKLSIEDLDCIGYALTVYKNDDKRISYLKGNLNNPKDDAIPIFTDESPRYEPASNPVYFNTICQTR